ncbi:MAG TPA: glucodextranase DOMON-like domain-containing protein [Dictyoglomaceae bacterium]|nr:glucodextranase DOMON-like domain-containing protein [Dictyoglomaceae bacterium]HOL39075.1 glucodextranase DOMON-like domain-containing protein [Dictyoglomaceae bacterium]HOP94414.1 glucodextranase DOMON-like domain-containing protein [Dictyoglomaceae bacterium]HPP15749.1 glucodextranase DOMON-like domain-containing protein [Dictyoglomaceae bacterium]HPU42737.1 glucodextranase DOMON-like domain-containing protein [Dictyoglomaceae bacterium]
MKKFYTCFLIAFLLLISIGTSDSIGEPPIKLYVSETKKVNKPLYVTIIWHNHQPFYYDSSNNMMLLPWVRMHAIKDYYDMASILKNYPQVKANFNMVPSLIYQLELYLNQQVKDKYLVLTEKAADELTNEDKDFILRRFFDANWDRIIRKFPRYWDLLNKRGQSVSDEAILDAINKFTVQDFRDLQVWFNLAWFDPDFQQYDKDLAKLIEKGKNFTEEDKKIVIQKQYEVMAKILPLYYELQKKKQIEVTSTPFFHPIMPLLANYKSALEASQDIELPKATITYPEDVEAQLKMAVTYYKKYFKENPKGLWPSEGSVSQEIIPLVSSVGIQWMASDEDVLSKSLGIPILRDTKGNVQNPEVFYKPYIVEENGKKLNMIFRDKNLSDKIGFVYSGMKGESAAIDLINRLEDIYEKVKDKEGPFLVSLILDGENCWEYYENDGKEFLNAFYKLLSDNPYIETVRVSDFLAKYPPKDTIQRLSAGSWVDGTFLTWIGEGEENKAWELFDRTRVDLVYATVKARKTLAPTLDPQKLKDNIQKAWFELYAAEGSDWFWWYGDDQDSGNDLGFDQLFRQHLINVYKYIEKEPPSTLLVPIVKLAEEKPIQHLQTKFTPKIDGKVAPEDEWKSAAIYEAKKGTGIFAKPADYINKLYFGIDNDSLYFLVESKEHITEFLSKPYYLAIYLSNPNQKEINIFPRNSKESLGYGISHEILIDLSKISSLGEVEAIINKADGNNGWVEVQKLKAAISEKYIEIGVPFKAINVKGRDRISFNVIFGKEKPEDVVPYYLPIYAVIPEAKLETVYFSIDDPVGDDYGWGGISYPTDPVFKPGVFDIIHVEMGKSKDNIVFRVKIRGELENSWGSPIGISLQTIDVYINDGKSNLLYYQALPGRQANIPEGWNKAIWVEGWTQELIEPTTDEKGKIQLKELKGVVETMADPTERTIIISVPEKYLGPVTPDWKIVVIMCGQEGYPRPGNWRVREVEETAKQWRFGGGDDSYGDPNIIDMIVPPGMKQEQILSEWISSDEEEENKYVEIPLIPLRILTQ